MKNRSRQRGILIADVVTAICMLGILLGVLSVTVNQQNRAAAKLNDSRHATRLAEQALAHLQMGRALQPAAEGIAVNVTYHDPVKELAGNTWATVVVQVNDRTASLTGIVPSAQATGGAE